MKKKHPEHVNLERWLVSYADFITLLFAFFVIMYAAAKSDKAKMTAVAQSIQKAFGGMSSVGVLSFTGSGGGNTVSPFQSEGLPAGRTSDLPEGKFNTAADPDPEMQEMAELLEESIQFDFGMTESGSQLLTRYDQGALVVSISAKDFFDPGSIEVKPDVLPVLDQIGKVLISSSKYIRIQGHLDFDEKSTQFSSPWDFSAARARWVLDHWAKKFSEKIKWDHFSIEGCSFYQPLTTQKDRLSRSKNRRVDILILKNK